MPQEYFPEFFSYNNMWIRGSRLYHSSPNSNRQFSSFFFGESQICYITYWWPHDLSPMVFGRGVPATLMITFWYEFGKCIWLVTFCQQKWVLKVLCDIDYLATFLLDLDNRDSYDDVYPVQELLAQECPLTCIRLLSLTNTKHFPYINTINTAILYTQLA